MLAYNLIGTVSVSHIVRIPKSEHIKELGLRITLDEEENEFSMKVGTEGNITFEVANVLLTGVYCVMKKRTVERLLPLEGSRLPLGLPHQESRS